MSALRILQGAGNSLDTLAWVHTGVVDGISADAWLHDGALRTHAAQPLATATRFLRRVRREAPAPPIGLPLESLLRTADAAQLVIELRGGGDAAPEAARALSVLPDRSRVLVTTDEAAIAEELRAWLPGLRVALRLESEGALRRFVQARMEGQLPGIAVVVDEALLHTRLELDSLARRALSVGVRGARGTERVRELEAWGADLVLSESLAALEAAPAG